jgi:rfaE bifunctional protein kinase chain/domain
MISNPEALLYAFRGKRILIVGDVMLDEFVRGNVRRISPEAPVPIVEVTNRETRLGGAANAAVNVQSLGGSAVLIGLVGADDGRELTERLLAEAGIERHLVPDASRPTTRKCRILAHGQQIVRVDSEATCAPPATVKAALFSAIDHAISQVDACIVSDYAKGTVTAESAAYVVTRARARGCKVIVDPKNRDFSIYRGASVLTPNTNELALAAQRPLPTERDVLEAAAALLVNLDGASILATRGADGMTLVQSGVAPLHVHALAKAVFDVTGAGDTVVATLALALAASASWSDALWAASVAAGIVVSKAGTATVTPGELLRELAEHGRHAQATP